MTYIFINVKRSEVFMILTDILKKNVKDFPKKRAFSMKVGYRTVHMNYQQIYDLARQVSLFLQHNGIKKGDPVLLFAPNSPYWGVVFWGIMLHGAVAVPLNVQSTPEMIKKIAAQTESSIIFTSRFLKTELPENVKTYTIEFIEELVKNFDPKNFTQTSIDENDLMQILYTSGTTGDPKGVLLTHKNIYSNLLGISKFFKIDGSQEKLLSILPLTHIFEQTIGFFLPFFYRAHIVYAHSYAAIADLMQEYKITKLLAVPEFLKVLLSKIKAQVEKKGKTKIFNKFLAFAGKVNKRWISKLLFYSLHKKFGGKLDTIASGGAFLDPKVEQTWNALGFTVLQGYGLTETAPVVTCNTYDERKLGSVGKVLDGVQVKISDEGEVLVKGAGVFSGYFKNEEKTKEVFTQDGFFKTGDMGYLDDDGFLFLKGRQKYVIVGPGAQNVFPEDIELELNKVEGVKDSCVVGLENHGGMIDIHAALLLESKDFDPQVIVDMANKRLATYQRVTGFTVWPYDDFERSATRKVKKEEVIKFLRAKQDGNLKQAQKETSQKSPLVKILSQVTTVPVSHIHEQTKLIADLKIDSLTRVELLLRIEQDLRVLIDEVLITDKTTVADLEQLIKDKPPVKKPPKLKHWPHSWWARCIRILFYPLIWLISKIFMRVKVEGLEHLKNINQPVLFMPNHISYVDPLAVFVSLPFKIRKKLAFMAAADVLYGEFKYVAWLAELLFNSVILHRKEGEHIKVSLDYIGRLLDKNYSVVIFPEGKVSPDGKLQKLKKGPGLLAVEMKVLVVPVRIVDADKVVPAFKVFPRKFFGKVKIRFGKPLKFALSCDYDDALQNIERELKGL